MQDVATTSDALRQIRNVMSMNKPLANKVNLVIKDKNQNDQARFENLLCYVLDGQTLEYLDRHYDKWMADQSLFDNTIKSSYQAVLKPWTRAISEYLDTELDHV